MKIELLPNGYYRIFDRGSKLSGLYKKDGLYHSGDLRLSITTAQELIASQFCAYFFFDDSTGFYNVFIRPYGTCVGSFIYQHEAELKVMELNVG